MGIKFQTVINCDFCSEVIDPSPDAQVSIFWNMGRNSKFFHPECFFDDDKLNGGAVISALGLDQHQFFTKSYAELCRMLVNAGVTKNVNVEVGTENLRVW